MDIHHQKKVPNSKSFQQKHFKQDEPTNQTRKSKQDCLRQIEVIQDQGDIIIDNIQQTIKKYYQNFKQNYYSKHKNTFKSDESQITYQQYNFIIQKCQKLRKQMKNKIQSYKTQILSIHNNSIKVQKTQTLNKNTSSKINLCLSRRKNKNIGKHKQSKLKLIQNAPEHLNHQQRRNLQSFIPLLECVQQFNFFQQHCKIVLQTTVQQQGGCCK